MRSCVRAIQASTGLVHRVTSAPTLTDQTGRTERPGQIQLATVLAGEWLGSRADDGRAKLR